MSQDRRKKSEALPEKSKDNDLNEKDEATPISTRKTTRKQSKEDAVENELRDIKAILKNVITKDDTSLKTLIVETIKEMKDDILKSVSHRIDILEGELHIRDIENAELKKEIETLKKHNESQESEKIKIAKEAEVQFNTQSKRMNDLEQYQRRNNLRVNGLKDTNKESAEQTAEKLCEALNQQITDLKVNIGDIDIAHRIGKYQDGKDRRVIVRFISRNMMHKVLKNKKLLKDEGMFIHEDLTPLNAEVLNSVRLKKKEEIEYAYSYSGNIYAKMRKYQQVQQIPFEDYAYWINLKWPERNR